MTIDSREKGKKGERELSHWFQAKGDDVRRGQQYSGTETTADLIGIVGIYPECKRVENLNIRTALNRALVDAPEHLLAAVFHRRNNGIWNVTMSLDDWYVMYDCYRKEYVKISVLDKIKSWFKSLRGY